MGPEIVLLSADSVDNEQDARSFSVGLSLLQYSTEKLLASCSLSTESALSNTISGPGAISTMVWLIRSTLALVGVSIDLPSSQVLSAILTSKFGNTVLISFFRDSFSWFGLLVVFCCILKQISSGIVTVSPSSPSPT